MKQKTQLDSAALERFVSTEWDKTLRYLGKTFGLSHDDCQDIFQDSFMILYQNISEGKLVELSCSLSTYFISICRNKALEMLRAQSKTPTVGDDTAISLLDGEFKEEKVNELIALDGNELAKEKQGLVSDIVENMPSPCNELLWGFYRDGLSLKSLAEIYNYSEGSVKVVKHRCTEKFKVHYREMVKKLF